MPKRIALFILGVVLAVGAFLLYQNMSGTSLRGGMGAAIKPEPPGASAVTLPTSFEGRDPNGRLEYLITAAKSPEPVKDDNGAPIPGRFHIDAPVATIYDKSGRTIEIRGDGATISMEPGPKGMVGGLPALSGGKGGVPVRTGQIKGNVRLTISSQPPDDPALPSKEPRRKQAGLEGGMRIYFGDGPVNLDHSSDMSQEIVRSDGAVRVRSDRAEFDGEGLELVFNGNAQRIEELRIERGDEVVIRGVGKDAFALGPPATKPAEAVAVAPPASATKPAATQAAKAPPAPTTYKISFGQNVKTHVGESELDCEQLFLLFMAGNGGPLGGTETTAGGVGVNGGAAASGDKGAAGAGVAASAPAPAVAGAATEPAWPDMPAPIGAAGKDDLVIHWTGPMEMRPSDDQDLRLVDANDVALEAVGPADKPVSIASQKSETNAGFAAKAGRLWFHRAEERIKLEPGDFARVEMTDASRGTVECAGLDYYQKVNRATLMGPGKLTIQSAVAEAAAGSKTKAKGPTILRWASRMDLDLEEGKRDVKNPEKQGNLLVKHATIAGANIKSDEFELTSEMLDVVLANIVQAKGTTTPALEHLLATGKVVVNSFRVARGQEEPDGLRAPRLEILTKVPKEGAAPVASQMIADGGNVSAWRSADKGSPKTATRPATVAWEKDMVSAAKIVADLSPKANVTEANAKSVVTDDSGLEQAYETTHFMATGDVTVDVMPPDLSRRVVATARELEADTVAGRAHLTGANAAVANGGGAKGVHVLIGAAGENSIDGETLLLSNISSQNDVGIEVPGPGRFHFVLPSEKTRERQPLTVTWTDGMTYDNKTKLAEFHGKTTAQLDGAKSELGNLTADKLLQVKLMNNVATASATRPATQPAGVATDLALDWIYAEGNVDAGGAQIDDRGNLMTSMDLRAEKLNYSNVKKRLVVPVPGILAMQDLVVKQGDPPGSKKAAVFRWDGGLDYDGEGNLITFTKNVRFDYQPNKPFSLGGPGGPAAGGGQGKEATKVELAHLTTQKLVATLTQAKAGSGETGGAKTVGSVIGLGNNGKQQVSHVDAIGEAVMSIGDNMATGDTLSFDEPTKMAIIDGTEDRLVELRRPGEPVALGHQVKWDMSKDRMTFEIVRPQVGGLLGR